MQNPDIQHLIIEFADKIENTTLWAFRRMSSSNDEIAEMLAFLVKPRVLDSAREALPRIGAVNQGAIVSYLPGGPQSLLPEERKLSRHIIITFRFRKPPHLYIYDAFFADEEDRPTPEFAGPLVSFLNATALKLAQPRKSRKDRPSYQRQLERARKRRAAKSPKRPLKPPQKPPEDLHEYYNPLTGRLMHFKTRKHAKP